MMRIVISIVLALCILVLCFTSCSMPLEDGTDVSDENMLLLYDGEKYNLEMVLPEGSESTITSPFFALSAKIQELVSSKKPISYKDDYVKNKQEVDNAKNEILVGETNRPATQSLLKDIHMKMCYKVEVDTDGITIVGNSSSLTAKAINYFMNEYLSENLVKIDNVYYIRCGEYTSEEDEEASFIAHAVLSYKSGVDFKYKIENYMNVVPVGDHWGQQGGCIDKEGNYAYFSFIDLDDNASLVKYDMRTKQVVLTKKNVQTNHSNDIAYNSNNNTIVVSHCTVSPTYVSIFDADTLELIEHKDIGISQSAISYNAKRNSYVVKGSGRIRVLDENFKEIFSFAHEPSKYTSQGMHCDDDYIYCIRSSGAEVSGNVIYIYDWEGNFIFMMKIPERTSETESIFHYGKDLYFTCYRGNRSGASLCKLSLVTE